MTKLTIWTIGLNLLIIIAIGHGAAPIFIWEAFILSGNYKLDAESFSLSFSAPYEKAIGIAVLFAFLGQVMLIISLLGGADKPKHISKLAGLLLLWTSYYYLSHHLPDNELARCPFTTGIPFLIVSMILAYKVIKHYRETFYDT